ncbi:hypothetical protein TWF718_005793 [Orbilia javanica]|uniref:Fucose-specific lectin n=1 Tax=Orbilia javanica TaxID=47235 RepID=A0AAN8MQF5_9PEZI
MASAYSSQPGYAVIPGFTDPNDPKKTPQILVFYNTANSNLAVELWKGDKSDARNVEDSLSALSTDRVGFVSNPTHLAAAALSGTNVVVGFTESESSGGSYSSISDPTESAPATMASTSTHKVSILSPIYQTLDDTDAGNVTIAIASSNPIAASSATEDDAWVYYLKTDTDNDNKLSVFEYSLSNREAAALGANPISGSSLSAYWDGSTRWVIYQGKADKKNNYQLFEHDPGNDLDAKIPGTGAATKCCKVAIAHDATTSKTYLYFTTDSGDIYRVIKDGKWNGSAAQISDSAKTQVAAVSQLAAIYSGGVVHLFFTNRDGRNPNKAHVVDDVSKA